MVVTEEDVFMDPMAAWDEMSAEIIRGDRERIAELADSLAEWIEKGGFLPVDAMKDGFNRSSLLQYCRDIRDVARMQ